ncbi:hypothetical protein KAI87_17475, partial [Myxococcota bacterium]|nr:hypothetical protein [Myxococcota bacterium]
MKNHSSPLFALLIALPLTFSACKDSTPSGGAGECTTNDACGAGEICNDGECISICYTDDGCDENLICENSLCVEGQRAEPDIQSVNGDGTSNCPDTLGKACIFSGIIVAGVNLSGASFFWQKSGTSTAVDLVARSGASAMLVGFDLPSDTEPGAYTLTVTNAAGTDQQSVELLQGPPGPDLTADEMVTRLNTASTKLGFSIFPTGVGATDVATGNHTHDALSTAITGLTDRLSTIETQMESIILPHQPQIDTDDGLLLDGNITSVGASGNGGNIAYLGGDYAYLLGRHVELPAFSQDALDATTIYHLRYELVAGAWEWSLSKLPYTVAGKVVEGTADENARYYDSNPQSLFAARIETVAAGNSAQILHLVNKMQLVAASSDETGRDIGVTYS